ncbi:MAG: hypothetical protein V3R25_10315 [Nitrosomonadaceae bacterium]
MGTFSVVGLVGFDEADRTTDASFLVNTTTVDEAGFVWTFVQANGAIAASQTDIAITTAGQASDGAGTHVNTTAFLDNEYGWVRSAAQRQV